MLTNTTHSSEREEIASASSSSSSRRNFLGQLVGLTAIGTLAACQKSVEPVNNTITATSSEDLNFGKGDIAILNYAYLLEQLEAAFYIMVTSKFYSGATEYEKKRFSQVRDHEIAHREFFKTALGSSAIPELEFDFSTIDFTKKASVLTNAKTFEDLGVSAYNGVAYQIKSVDYLLAAGKIVSVEARHAAFIRDLIDPVSFADSTVVDANGLDVANPPSVVIAAADPFILTPLKDTWFPM